MRCPDCNKFVSFDTDSDPECDVSVNNEGMVTVQTRIVNTCAECSQELTEATFDIEVDLTGPVSEHRATCAECQTSKEDLEASAEGTRLDRRQTHDRHGKPIKNPRYQKQFYGAEVTVDLQMPCGEIVQGTASDEIQASGMEELV